MLQNYIEKIKNICYSISISKRKGGEVEMEEKVLSVFEVANFFRKKEKMTHKKLQKLVYYAYAWYIALYNEDKNHINNRLSADTKFEAWVHGPVCRKLYDSYSGNYGVVEKYTGDINPIISGELKRFLDDVYKTFGKYTGDELETMTHQEYPWQNARNNIAPSLPSNNVILEEDMFTFYNKL